MRRGPPSGGLAVRCKLHVREQLLVRIVIDKVSDHPTKPLRQLRCVRANNEFCIGATAHQIRREQITAHLTLSVARGHRDHQALALASNHPIKRLGNDPVVIPDQHLWPDVLTERKEVRGARLAGLQLLETELKSKLFGLNVRRYRKLRWFHKLQIYPRGAPFYNKGGPFSKLFRGCSVWQKSSLRSRLY